MMPLNDIERWRRVDALFAEALALHAEDRTRFLEQQCAGDDALLAEVRELLSAHMAASTFLDAPPTWLGDLKAATLGLGELLVSRGKAEEAEPLLREALRIRRKALPEGDWLIAASESALGAALAELGRYGEAEPLVQNSYHSLLASRGENDPATQRAREHLQRFQSRVR